MAEILFARVDDVDASAAIAAAAAAEAARAAAVVAQAAAELAETNAETAETNAETAETNAETAETNAELAETNAETAQAAAEVAQGLAEDAQSYAEEWAINPEDDPVSVAAGGDDLTTFSALHWAAKAAATAAAIGDLDSLSDVVITSPADGSVLTFDSGSGTWIDAPLPGGSTPDAADVTFTPAGGIAATDVQAAIEELDTEKEPADATILKDADIGGSVQAWDAQLDSLSAASANGVSLVTAANYAAMRTLLDLEAGTDFYSIAAADAAFQPLDADLTTWAGLTPSANAQSLVTAANYAAMRTLLDLEAGTDFYSIAGADAAFQPLDGGLTDIAGLAVTDGNIIVGDGANWVAESGATARASLGLTIGTHVQAWDAQLDSLSAASANGVSLITAADYAAMKALLDLEIGTDVQAFDADTLVDAIEFVIDGGGSTITTGVKGYLEVPYACTINRATLLADQSGSIVIDVWKDTYANFPPTDADSITASAPPTISTATKSQDATLTGWTVSCAAGDILAFNVDSVTSIQRVTISLKVAK